MRWTLWTCPKINQCEALLTAASHISHSSRHVPQSSRSSYASCPPHPLTSLTFNGFDCRKRTLLSRAYYYPRTSYWDASVHLDSCSLFLPVVRQTGFPTATPSRITNLGPSSHLDGSRCHIRPAFVLPSFQNKPPTWRSSILTTAVRAPAGG